MCGRVSIASARKNSSDGHVLLFKKGESVIISGLVRCQSASACVCCSSRISFERGQWLSSIFDSALDQGRVISMITLTVRHKKSTDLREMLNAMYKAYENVQGTLAYKELRGKYGAKFVRVTEVTHGKNGYHPHFHIAVLHEQGAEWDSYRRELEDAWVNNISKNGLEAPLADKAVDIVQNATNPQRAWYLTKASGLSSLEVSNGKHKMAKNGNLGIWQIHAKAVEGDEVSKRVWAEYENAIKGKRIFLTSRGLEDQYGIYMRSEAEVADDEFLDVPMSGDWVEIEQELPESPIIYISGQEETEFVASITSETYDRVMRAGLTFELRQAVRGGYDVLQKWLYENYLPPAFSKSEIINARTWREVDLEQAKQAFLKGDSEEYWEKMFRVNLADQLPHIEKALNR